MKYFFTFFLIFCFKISFSQPSILEWVTCPYGNNSYRLGSSAVDLMGNVCIAGYFTGTTLVFGSDTLRNNGSEDMFVAKFNANGDVMWAKSAGGLNNDGAAGVAVDRFGNVFVTGSFTSRSITFDTITLQNNDTSAIEADMFVIKFDTSGNVVWVKTAGGAKDEYGTSLTTDMQGNIYWGGRFTDNVINFEAVSLSNAGEWDLFLVKLDVAGNVIWAKREGGILGESPTSLSVDSQGNLLVAGRFGDSHSFFNTAPTTFGNTTFTNEGTDLFIAKYDSSGNFLWARAAGGQTNDYSSQVTTDALNNVILTGLFLSKSLKFSNTSDSLINVGIFQMFLIKYSPSGDIVWMRSADFDSGSYAAGYAVYTDSANDVYITGSFADTCIFSGIPLISNGYNDLFVVKYSSTGTALWARHIGSTDYDDGRGIAVNNANQLYLVGHFSSTVDFDFGVGSHTLSSTPSYGEIFIAKYSQTLLPLILESFSATRINRDIRLQWHTAQEQNLFNFVVERKTLGSTFQKVGTVAASGNPLSSTYYSFIDSKPFSGSNLYRLKMVDKDGAFIYSQVVAINFQGYSKTLQVYPNPAKDELKVIAYGENGTAQLTLMDELGRVLKQGIIILNKETSLDIRKLSAGKYILVLRVGDTNEILHFIKP